MIIKSYKTLKLALVAGFCGSVFAGTTIEIIVDKGLRNIAKGNWDTVTGAADERKTIARIPENNPNKVALLPSTVHAKVDLGTKVFITDELHLAVDAQNPKQTKPTPKKPGGKNILELTKNNGSISVATYIIDPIFSVHDAKHWGKLTWDVEGKGKGDPPESPWEITVQAGIDLDIDSDNNNFYSAPSPRSYDEDLIEEDAPGKYFGINDNDIDRETLDDLILGYCDGFDLDGSIKEDDVVQKNHQWTAPFVPVMLDVHDPLDAMNNVDRNKKIVYTDITYTFSYVASDPKEAKTTAIKNKDGKLDYYNCQSPIGYRLWKADSSGGMPVTRNKKPVTEQGHFVPTGTKIKAKDLGMEDGKHQFFLEAIPKLADNKEGGNWSLPSAGMIEVKAEFQDLNGKVVWTEKVYFTPVQIDLDIDSDNNDKFKKPARSYKEDNIENTLKHKEQHPGKYLSINDNDTDGAIDSTKLQKENIFISGGIPGWADGFNRYPAGGKGPATKADDKSANDKFVPVVIAIPDYEDRKNARIKLTYAHSDPNQDLIEKGNGTEQAPFVYKSPDQLTGSIRLWTKKANVKRKYQSIDDSSDKGHFVPSGEFDWALLDPENTGTVTLYLEALKPSENLADLQIRVELDPDGKDKPAGYVALDAIRATAIKFDLDTEIDGEGPIAKYDYDDDDVEETEGAVIAVNNDDDNEDGKIDQDLEWRRLGVENENDFKKFTINCPNIDILKKLKAKLTVKIDSKLNNGKPIRLFKDKVGDKVFFDEAFGGTSNGITQTWDFSKTKDIAKYSNLLDKNSKNNITFFVEATHQSMSRGDIGLAIDLSVNEKVIARDLVKITTLLLEMQFAPNKDNIILGAHRKINNIFNPAVIIIGAKKSESALFQLTQKKPRKSLITDSYADPEDDFIQWSLKGKGANKVEFVDGDNTGRFIRVNGLEKGYVVLEARVKSAEHPYIVCSALVGELKTLLYRVNILSGLTARGEVVKSTITPAKIATAELSTNIFLRQIGIKIKADTSTEKIMIETKLHSIVNKKTIFVSSRGLYPGLKILIGDQPNEVIGAQHFKIDRIKVDRVRLKHELNKNFAKGTVVKWDNGDDIESLGKGIFSVVNLPGTLVDPRKLKSPEDMIQISTAINAKNGILNINCVKYVTVGKGRKKSNHAGVSTTIPKKFFPGLDGVHESKMEDQQEYKMDDLGLYAISLWGGSQEYLFVNPEKCALLLADKHKPPTLSHEILHSLGLKHRFSNNKEDGRDGINLKTALPFIKKGTPRKNENEKNIMSYAKGRLDIDLMQAEIARKSKILKKEKVK